MLVVHTTAFDCVPHSAGQCLEEPCGRRAHFGLQLQVHFARAEGHVGWSGLFFDGVFDVSGVTVFAFSGVDVPGLTAPWIMGEAIMRKLPKCAQSQALTRSVCCVGRIHEQQRPEVEGVDPFLSAEEMIQL